MHFFLFSFLNFFLPTETHARKAHKALANGGVDGCFYWYDNNWHYYRKWEHLTNQKSLGKLPEEVKNGLQDFSKTDFSQSDHWVGRTISCLIKLGWNEEEASERAQKMVTILSNV